MQIKELYNCVKKEIKKNDFFEIVRSLFKTTAVDIDFDTNLSSKNVKDFFFILKQYKKGKPLAYLLKTKYFFENEFYINKNVLIPRNETELLVEELLEYSLKNKVIYDICCGSGCIGISLKIKEPTINLNLCDISKKCIKVVKKNLKKFNLKANIYCANFLDPVFKNPFKPDFIVINPPYIEEGDINIDIKTLKHEPHLALFAPNKGMHFYETLFENLIKLYSLNTKLIIMCEFGFNQKEQLETIFKKYGVKYEIEFKQDYSHHWRYFIIKSKELYGQTN
ncbi:release factor glutamine methyltransferase [Spiroplasma gladiatoris]|uniref:peptide chain release factor N(5)-glutamine methyltransferase n=1 Tax=Spiroplasma gladiatoris TaxID=2143 RepID=A0A4P7AIT3_9MOLU|nr:peptide chain release factor N(5)-glutamine methyltransferase [Spiroplasma gladiatoris]QBQ08182.1 release factor glutamine methyltransferase [Spiroplasma gladiatoris]